MAGYLFAHFIGEQKDGEQVYFSISKNGLFWTDINDGKPVLRSDIGEGGARDPFLVKDERHGIYYLIATDLCIHAGKGWAVAQHEGSRDLLVWESKNLVDWSEVRAVTVGVQDAGCVWAPEVIYDNEKEAFFVFWASMVKRAGDTESKQRIYGSYTNDFTRFTEPEIYIEKENHVIDTTIIHDNGIYYRFSKNESNGRIGMDACTSLHGTFEPVCAPELEELAGVEGPECYLLPDQKTWCLIVDRFAEGKGYVPLLIRDLAGGKMRVLRDDEYDMGQTKKRHGGIIRIADEEYQRLAQMG